MVVERLPCFFSFPFFFFFNPLSKWIEETLRVHSTHSGVAEAAATAFLGVLCDESAVLCDESADLIQKFISLWLTCNIRFTVTSDVYSCRERSKREAPGKLKPPRP